MGLIDAIKLAVHQHEINNPHQVEIDYSSATMDTEGKNDVMTYISVLATFMRRLEAAGLKVPDAKAQRVLLNGVHQDIFESFINEAERNPYESYRELVTAFKTASARPRMSAKLAALKPGRAQIMTAVSAPHRISSQESRFAQIESVLVALGNASLTAGSSKHNNTNNITRPSDRACFRWEKFGECKNGDACTFSHAGPKGKSVSSTPANRRQLPTSPQRQGVQVPSRHCYTLHGAVPRQATSCLAQGESNDSRLAGRLRVFYGDGGGHGSCLRVHHERRDEDQQGGGRRTASTTSATFTDSSACALVKTSRTVKWLRGIKAAFERRDEANMPPTPVYVDNAGVLSMVNDVTIKAANKHIYRTLAEARVLVQVEKVVTPIKIATNDNISNAMTKQEPGIEKSAAQLRQVTGPALY